MNRSPEVPRFQFESVNCLVSGIPKEGISISDDDKIYEDSETVKVTSYQGLGRDSLARGIVQRC